MVEIGGNDWGTETLVFERPGDSPITLPKEKLQDAIDAEAGISGRFRRYRLTV